MNAIKVLRISMLDISMGASLANNGVSSGHLWLVKGGGGGRLVAEVSELSPTFV